MMNPQHNSLEFTYHGKTLIAEWDNRQIPRSCFTTIVFVGFWCIWPPATAVVTYLLMIGTEPRLFFCFWLVFGYAGVVLLSMTWVLRHTVERIEIDNKCYRHYFVNLPWWFPKHWDAADITQVTFGNYDGESMATLSVWRDRNRDMIAYWAKPEFREHLFDTIRTHLSEIESRIPTINMNLEANAT